MKVAAVVRTRNIDKNTRRIEVFSPKYQNSNPLIMLNAQYENLPVMLVTGWADIPHNTPVTINGSITPDDQVGVCSLASGMYLTSFGDPTIYVVVPATLL